MKNRESSDNFAEGIITSQDETAGELVNEGTKINVTVSTGPESTETGGNTGGNTGSDIDAVNYTGTLVISSPNPFDYVQTPDDTAEIILEMEQDGYATEIYAEIISRYDFPLTVPVESDSGQRCC